MNERFLFPDFLSSRFALPRLNRSRIHQRGWGLAGDQAAFDGGIEALFGCELSAQAVTNSHPGVAPLAFEFHFDRSILRVSRFQHGAPRKLEFIEDQKI